MPILLGAACIIVIVIVINYSQNILNKITTRSTEKFAHSLDLTFTEDQQPAVPVIPGDFLLFAQGIPFSRRNVVEGLYNGFDIAIFTYTFANNLGEMREFFQQTVIHIRSIKYPIPQFNLYPQEQLDTVINNLPTKASKDRLLETAGFRLPHHRDFRNEYKLMGSDRQQLVAIFDNESVNQAYQELNTKPYRHLICLEGAGHQLLIYPLYKQVSPKKISQLLDKSILFVKKLESVTGGELG